MTEVKPYTVELHAGEREWLQARCEGVGASEASAVVGLSRFCSPFGLYWRKREGRYQADDQADAMMEMRDAGHRHERTIADWFLEQTAEHGVRDLRDPGDYTIYRSSERPHVFFTPDRMAVGTLFTGERPVEMKCAWYEAAKVWRERVPIGYQVQAQQELYVTGAPEGFFAVLLDGYRFRWYRVERHEKFIARLCNRIDDFWERVQRRDPPPIDGSKSSLHAIFCEHPKDNGKAVELPDDLAAEVEAHWDASQRIAANLAREKDELKARIQQFMGDAKYATLPDGTGFRWSRTDKTSRFERVEKVRTEDGQL